MNMIKVGLLSLVPAVCAHAGLGVSYQFNGTGDWSIDAIGGAGSTVGNVQASVPVGSTVERAFLYSSLITGESGLTAPSVTFDGTVIGPASWTSLGSITPSIITPGFQLGAYRADVTSQVAAKVGGGSGSRFDFLVQNESVSTNNTLVDGEVLAVVYSNPASAERTIVLLDGSNSTAGDTITFNSAAALDPSTPGFEALLSLGIGYSGQTGISDQYSQVDVNGRRLTTAAGGQDDGTSVNGALITAGGLDDSPLNPVDPFATPTNTRDDDELYNLALGNGDDASPFINVGDTSIDIRTLNPSNDDLIFFAGFNITAEGDVDIPEPASMALLGLPAVALLRRRRVSHC